MAEPKRQRTETGRKPLSEAGKAARRQYMTAYRAKNPERVRAWNRSYWERKAAARAEQEPENGIDGGGTGGK